MTVISRLSSPATDKQECSFTGVLLYVASQCRVTRCLKNMVPYPLFSSCSESKTVLKLSYSADYTLRTWYDSCLHPKGGQWVKFLTSTIFHLDCSFLVPIPPIITKHTEKFHWCLSDIFWVMIFLFGNRDLFSKI